MKIAYSLPSFILFSILACKKPVAPADENTWLAYKNPIIATVTLRDTLPKRFLTNLTIKEVHGIKASYTSHQYTSYFEYEADAKAILKIISSLPFRRGNAISDTTCRKFDTSFSLTGKKVLSKEEVLASKFFWEIDPQDFFYYECLKNPARHTILINRKTRRILHRIESIS